MQVSANARRGWTKGREYSADSSYHNEGPTLPVRWHDAGLAMCITQETNLHLRDMWRIPSI